MQVEFSSKNLLTIILVASCILGFAACGFVNKNEPSVMQITNQVQHPDGLTVGVPQGFAAQQTDNGFVIEPEGGSNSRVRRPVAVYVSLKKNAGAPQDLSFQTKSLAGREIRYRIDKSEGGSGGETYTLEAYEVVPNGQIEYSQATQSEYEEPDFALSWSIIQATKFNAAVK